MGDFVHCNSCFCLPNVNGQKFFLTSCGHVFCQKCVSLIAAKENCQVCSQQCTSIEINHQMKPEVQMFFMDAPEVIKKQQKQLFQVMNFQKSQRDRMLANMKNQQKKFQQMAEYFQQEMKKKQDLQKELASTKDCCRQLAQALQTQTGQKLNNITMTAYRPPITPATVVSTKTVRETPLFMKQANETPLQIAPVLHTPTSSGSANRSASANHFGVPMSASLTTPIMLGFERLGQQRNSANPYDNVWPRHAAVSPMNASPCNGNSAINSNQSVPPQIKLPFRLNASSLPR